MKSFVYTLFAKVKLPVVIVDCHTHIWPSLSGLGLAQQFDCLGPDGSNPARPEEHASCVSPAQAALVLGFASRLLQTSIPNDFIKQYVQDDPGRLIGFAGVDPTQPGCLDQIHRLRDDDGFAGLVLSPVCQGFHPCDTRMLRVYELAEKLKMPIYLLYGGRLPSQAMLEFGRPSALDEIARSFPCLKMILSHLGFPWIEETFMLLAKHPNIYSDVAGLAGKPWQAYRSLSLAHEYHVIDKLLFASDFPNHTVKGAAEALYNINKITLDSVLPAVPRELLRGIVERDSLQLLGLAPAANVSTQEAEESTS